ncbi:hypothetical protein [Campylobacter sputorum]|uniref:hypothetical protein n=1 Tax=Campylobacter sputorum TaxID=206 RepID=UPI000A464CAF|nr:hypothetical protein [Campylobacter sputorum]
MREIKFRAFNKSLEIMHEVRSIVEYVKNGVYNKGYVVDEFVARTGKGKLDGDI